MTGPRRKIVLASLVALLALAAYPGYFFVRAVFFPPTFDVVSIRTGRYQDAALLARAWALPVAREFRQSFVSQTNGSVCGPSSVANVLTSLGTPSTEASILEGTGKCWTGVCWGGLSLDVIAEMAGRKTQRKVTVIRDFSYDEFRRHLPRFNDPNLRYIANFHRGLLFGKGVGHHSPIGGYLEPEGLVFVLDVNAEFEPWLVDPRRLYDAINSKTSGSGKTRGLLLIE